MARLHSIQDHIDHQWSHPVSRPVIGLDLGSRGSKAVLLAGDQVATATIATGLYMQETADELIAKLLEGTGVARSDVALIVSTGYGRISLSFSDTPYEVVTEISCHAMGAHAVHPATRTIIDIGGQDSKAIKVDPRSGKVIEFVMNDKCAAGTGRFLEKAASLLGISLDQMGEVALKAVAPAVISSQCVVFAESEMVSLRAKGARFSDHEAVANIAAGIHYSAARRVKNLLGRIGNDPDLVFTGGVSKNPGMKAALEELIGSRFVAPDFDMMYAGALGAAVYATQYLGQTRGEAAAATPAKGGFLHLAALVDAREQEIILGTSGAKRVGHFCAYTPVEILAASGADYLRLFKMGTPETVAQGEFLTQSVFCDFSKACLGGFLPGEGALPLYQALDKVYNFDTCGSMKRVSEVIAEVKPTKLLNLPKLRGLPTAREFFRNELLDFAADLETLTGKKIEEKDLRAQITVHNRLRSLLKSISELRLRDQPPLSGQDFLELVRAYFYLKPEQLWPLYEETYLRLAAQKESSARRPLRIVVVGSLVADQDRRLVKLIEDELGAAIVAEDHCTGLKPFQHQVDEKKDPWTALAEGYLDQAPCARMKAIEDSVDQAVKLAQDYRADGVVYVYLKFCACYGVTKKDFIDRFAGADIPLLDISSDYSENDHGQIKTRLEAFFEVLASRSDRTRELVTI